MNSTAMVEGRTRAALVLQDDPLRAFVTPITARIRPARGRRRLQVCGPARLDLLLLQHVLDTILPLIDLIADLLHLFVRRPTFELSFANCAAASVLERGMCITDFSADVALFLATFAALLHLRLPQNVVATGHMRSREGELGPVAHLGLRVDAVRRTRGLRRFVYPTMPEDLSLEALGPHDTAGAGLALARASHQLSIRTAADVYELVRIVFDQPTEIVRASLKAGFFRRAGQVEDDGSAVSAIAQYLTSDLDAYFWQALETQLLAGDTRAARELVTLHARFQERSGVYSSGWGRRLLSLVSSLPGTMLAIKSPFPLLTPRSCAALAKYATADDHADLACLQQAVSGSFERPGQATQSGAEQHQVRAVTQAILDEISVKTLATKIGQPIDTARLGFSPVSNTTTSTREFDETVTSLHLAMLRCLGTDPGPANIHYTAEALALLSRAFATEGGTPAARVEAATGTHGGLRFVLDKLTDQLTHELQIAHIRQVAETTINARPWHERRLIIDTLCAEVTGPGLAELPESRREQLTQHAAEFLVDYVRIRDELHRRLRSF